MKRSVLLRRAPLRTRSRLTRSRSRPREDTLARMVWTEPHQGWCGCGCDPKTFAPHLERHHVVAASKLKQIGRRDELWNLANSILLCPRHHAWHTDHFKLIRIEFVPVDALAFAVDVLGEAGAMAYFRRYYDCTVTA